MNGWQTTFQIVAVYNGFAEKITDIFTTREGMFVLRFTRKAASTFQSRSDRSEAITGYDSFCSPP